MRMEAAKHKGTSGDDRAAALRIELARRIGSRMLEDGVVATAVPGMSLSRRSAPTACASAAYEPSLIVFAQGRKQINLGKTTYVCDSSNFLLTSVDLPVVSQVIAATGKEPLLGLMLKMEMGAVREILAQQEFHVREEAVGAVGMAVGTTTAELLDACLRLMDLLDAPEDIPILSSLIQREIIYRLLRSPQGRHLRAIATLGEQGHRTAKAVEWSPKIESACVASVRAVTCIVAGVSSPAILNMLGIISSRPCDAVNVVPKAPACNAPWSAPAAPPSLCSSSTMGNAPQRFFFPSERH